MNHSKINEIILEIIFAVAIDDDEEWQDDMRTTKQDRLPSIDSFQTICTQAKSVLSLKCASEFGPSNDTTSYYIQS